MTLVWTDWLIGNPKDGLANNISQIAAATRSTPYVDWYLNHELPAAAKDEVVVWSQPGLRNRAAGDLPWIALPKKALPPKATEIKVPSPVVLDKTKINSAPKPDDVIIGIIDAGLALSHARFRRMGGTGTRVLSFWQQGSAWQGQRHLPFGREMMQAEIDALIAQSEGCEAAFNRAAGLVDFADPAGERWLETAAPHGTHVADLAAGADPMDPDQADFRDRTHLIMVDLAPRFSIGPSGSFLELYVIWAMRHIVETAEALWHALYEGDPRKGFPIVINLSYGLQAGPKDGSMVLQKEIRLIQSERLAKGLPPLRIMLPAGNDNLEQGAASFEVDARGQHQEWRILPEDRTSSYAEVWTDVLAGDGVGQDTHPFAVSLTTPGGVAGPGSAGPVGYHCDLIDEGAGKDAAPLARIYCRRSNNLDGPDDPASDPLHRFVYVLCVAPTWAAERSAAPAGLWTIALKGRGTALLYVQSDQDLAPGASTGLLSYFDDPAYQRHEADGRLRDTYRSDPVSGRIDEVDSRGAVSRRNTVNAIANSAGTATVGGYRGSDGWPADYSASSRGFPRGGAPSAGDPLAKGGHGFVDVAAVSDDGVWALGRLAAGSRSGSAVVMQGTSFATAEATRVVAGLLLAWQTAAVDLGALATVEDAAAVTGKAFVPATELDLKLGAGRLSARDHGRVPRLERLA